MDPTEFAQRVETNELIAGMINDLRDQLAEALSENERLRAALEHQIEMWQMAKDTMDADDARLHRVKFMEFHDPIGVARAALEAK